MTSDEKIQAVYDMEVNADICWFWDNGFFAVMGDFVNGLGERESFETHEKAVNWIYEKALKIKAERDHNSSI